MIQLGIAAFYHDSAAALVINGEVIAAAEEERFTEIKHDRSFPVNAIKWCLEYSGVKIEEVDQVCWYEQPEVKKDRVLTIFNKRPLRTLPLRLRFLKEFKENDPKKLLEELGYTGNIVYTPHHLSHAAFSYFTSPYDDAAILTVDGVGEWDTVGLYNAYNGEIKQITSIEFPHSLGMLYSTFTAYLGFKPNEGEYKVMGLAPYGDSSKYYDKIMEVFSRGLYKFKIDQKYFTWEYSERVMFNHKLGKLLGLGPRLPEDKLTQEHKDLAASLQKVYEDEFLKLAQVIQRITRAENLCLGGGCAYNGVANAKAYKYFNSIHIPYAPSDAGSAIGACLYHSKNKGINTSPYLGPDYSEQEILQELEKNIKKVKAYRLTERVLIDRVANIIANNNIVGWFQGRMEFGARALGNRSILASPHTAEMRTKLNYVIKKREGFRPFAPSVTEEQAEKWFKVQESIPYMNQVVLAKTKKLPSATHVDGTCRVHTVSMKQNERYHKLLSKMGTLTGAAVLLNTSFNLKDQTITMTPKQAIERFINSDIDYLVINNFLIEKI